MQLRSTAFADGSTIPARFTCDGEDLSPPLDWDNPPEGSRSFVRFATIRMLPPASGAIGRSTIFRATGEACRRASRRRVPA